LNSNPSAPWTMWIIKKWMFHMLFDSKNQNQKPITIELYV